MIRPSEVIFVSDATILGFTDCDVNQTALPFLLPLHLEAPAFSGSPAPPLTQILMGAKKKISVIPLLWFAARFL